MGPLRTLQPGSKLPVLFWIMAGPLCNGCGSEKEFDGEGMARKGVILVTVNYRVNVFGFSPTRPGSRNPRARLRQLRHFDQLFALKWVREHRCLWRRPGQDHCRPVRRLHERFRHLSSSSPKGCCEAPFSKARRPVHAMKKCPTKEEITQTSQKTYGAPGSLPLPGGLGPVVPAGQLRDAATPCRARTSAGSPMWTAGLPATTDALAEAGAIHDTPYMIGSTGNDIGDGKLLQESGACWCETC